MKSIVYLFSFKIYQTLLGTALQSPSPTKHHSFIMFLQQTEINIRTNVLKRNLSFLKENYLSHVT